MKVAPRASSRGAVVDGTRASALTPIWSAPREVPDIRVSVGTRGVADRERP